MTRNEDTGENVVCPFCRTSSECAHLVAIIDRTFGGCVNGPAFDRYNEFQAAIEKAFLILLRAENPIPDYWQGTMLEELWEAIEEQDLETEYIYINDGILDRLVIDLLSDAGAIDLSGSDDVDRPGQSSTLTAVYAEDPDSVFNAARSTLDNLLAVGLPISPECQQ